MVKERTLSPSSINTYFRCPRLYYYNYILKERGPFNIHLYKGTFVHKTVENLFMLTKYVNMDYYVDERMKEWNPPDYLFDSDDEAKFHRDETEKILKNFVTFIEKKIDMVLMEGKVNGENHAWNYIKPKLREHRIKDKELNILGIIDSVQTNFDDEVYLIDYKTSKIYKNTISGEYIRQLRIYAYLYYSEFGKLPDYVGVHYLRYGEVYFLPVSLINENIVDSVKKDVEFVRENTKSTEINDYPKCEFEWCDCHSIEKKLSDDSE